MTKTPIRLLIAGCGDLGMRVAHRILQNPANRVWGLRRTFENNDETIPGLTWHRADLSVPETLADLPEGITHILFSAAPNVRTEKEYRAVYLNGLQNIVSAGYNPALTRIIFVSSTAVYGEHSGEWVDEQTPIHPKNFNGCVLAEAEKWLEQFGLKKSLATINVRLSGIYGPGRTYLLEKLKLGQAGAPSMPVHWTNRIHVDDASAAVVHLLSLTHPEKTYIVTDSTPLPMRTLYEDLAQRVGGPVPAEGAAPDFVGSKRLSNAKLLATGFKLRWPDCREGYAQLIQSG